MNSLNVCFYSNAFIGPRAEQKNAKMTTSYAVELEVLDTY